MERKKSFRFFFGGIKNRRRRLNEGGPAITNQKSSFEIRIVCFLFWFLITSAMKKAKIVDRDRYGGISPEAGKSEHRK